MVSFRKMAIEMRKNQPSSACNRVFECANNPLQKPALHRKGTDDFARAHAPEPFHVRSGKNERIILETPHIFY